MPNSGKTRVGTRHYNDTTLASHIFLLTRVTRIFQKSVFTETMPRRPGGTPRRAFCRAGGPCPRNRKPGAVYFFAADKERNHDVSQVQKRESGPPAARVAQADDGPH